MAQRKFEIDGGLEVRGDAVFNGSVDMNGNNIINVAAPVSDTDIATKAWVEAYVAQAFAPYAALLN